MSQLPSILDADQVISKLLSAFKSYSSAKSNFENAVLLKETAKTKLDEFYQTYSPIKSGQELIDYILRYDELSKNLEDSTNNLRTCEPEFKKFKEDLTAAIPYEGVKFEPETGHFVRKVGKPGSKVFQLEYNEPKNDTSNLEVVSIPLTDIVDPIIATRGVINFLEEDLNTYHFVTHELKRKEYMGAMGPPNENIFGGLCFGMALTAFGAFDLLAYIIEGGVLERGETGKNFRSLISEGNKKKYFGDAFPEIDHEIFYNVLRNGMVHKLFPKSMGLGADVELNDWLMGGELDLYSLNTYYLLQQTINGYSSFLKEMEHLKSESYKIEIYNSQILTLEEGKKLANDDEISTFDAKIKLLKDLKAAAEEAQPTLDKYGLRFSKLRLSDRSQFLQAFEKIITEKRDRDRSASESGNIPKVKTTPSIS